MSCPANSLDSSRGFTLIEIFIGLLIFGLLLMLGMPSFTTFLRNSEIRSTAESLINGLRTASAEAANRNQQVAFTLTGDAASWKINVVSDPETRTLEEPPIQQYTSNEAGKSFVIATTPADQRSVIFTGLGRVLIDRADRDDHIHTIQIGPTSGGGRPLRIVVDDPTDPPRPRGLRMCDPDPHLKDINDPRAC